MTSPRIDCPGCAKGIEMCEQRRPCWTTLAETLALEAAGFGPRLMLDFYSYINGDEHVYVNVRVPAIVGYETLVAPFWPIGRCTFLTADNRCELHDLGLKPAEGAVSCCKQENEPPLPEQDHRLIADTWRNA